MKQIENELRQKLDTNMTTKSCLQAKQKECDELEKRLHELTNARHNDMMQLQAVERRLAEERRQKQSLDAQLNNEKKARKLAEEKAARPECSSQCKQRKQQMEEEIKQLRRDLKMAEEATQMAEQHGRKWEQEVSLKIEFPSIFRIFYFILLLFAYLFVIFSFVCLNRRYVIVIQYSLAPMY